MNKDRIDIGEVLIFQFEITMIANNYVSIRCPFFFGKYKVENFEKMYDGSYQEGDIVAIKLTVSNIIMKDGKPNKVRLDNDVIHVSLGYDRLLEYINNS